MPTHSRCLSLTIATSKSRQMHHRFDRVKDKLRSLPPLHTQGAKSPWWILADYQHPMDGRHESSETQRMTTGELLQLMLDILHIGSESDHELPQNFWQSPCTRFCIGCHKPKPCVSRLYVQKRTDYLSCVELYIDGELAVGFREPVWPHLQHHSANPGAFIEVPSSCVDRMRTALATSSDGQGCVSTSPDYASVSSSLYALGMDGRSAA